MRQPIRLSDYTPPSHLIERVDLTFRLDPTATRVTSKIRFRPNPARPGADLRLDGEDLKLISATIDGAKVEVAPDATGLTLPAAHLPDGPFDWQAEVEIDPQANTALEGLYISKGMYCTQCEAEGFRRITYYPDRPDVMAPFKVRIESDLPVLLSNGNPAGQGAGWAEWDDPHPKPAYLFALVAGDLVATRDRFTTASGRDVDLAIWVRKGDEDKTGYAMDALKRSMAWDERRYGREYDLDQFNVVAVDDFNMGAMENKGLNIFNSRYVLASPEIATDEDYASIERIIAHEYFHNWTGNRITCRDWFQLSLKEGLTVYRDQQFMAEARGGAVQRINEALTLRARQFREDGGPLAHPVRPSEYVEINNFYTATVYEKGAEVIRMLATLVGEEGYAKALDLYFDRHDGQACTIEDWLKVFEEATGRDLSQFKRWYEQAGTPRVRVSEEWQDGRFRLRLSQTVPPTPGQPKKAPMAIPVALGLIGANGQEVAPTQVVELTEDEITLDFEGLGTRPVPSLLRGFSAPVVLVHAPEPGALAHLLAHDTDPFARWEAGRRLALQAAEAMILEEAPADPAWLAALAPVVRDESLDPAFRALMLRLPDDETLAAHLADRGTTPDPDAIHAARRAMRRAVAGRFDADLRGLVNALAPVVPYSPDAASAGRRALRMTALGLVAQTDRGEMAEVVFKAADNMTEQLAALACLIDAGRGETALAAFHDRWQQERLVIDKWFALQTGHAQPARAVTVAEGLSAHPDFDWTNPNRFRALFGGLVGNHAGFHRSDGSGYDLLADWLIRLDARNPQFAARMSTAFEAWRRYDSARQARARAALERIGRHARLSRDMGEMVERMLE
ncbi:aminopeptidase N [Pararhodobacter sp. SW119]|uniref:aminopeptidase N n=1 Tax=Pararhodobacter sp. SW119 TaxID=2780075 RepID=UPI001ADF3947|nr:aminopeptidase N [Pararhodobacter sp. SW119]